MHGDVTWTPEAFCCVWRLSSTDKDLTKPDKTREKSPALRGGGMSINVEVCL